MYKFEIYITDDTGILGTSHDHVPTSMITADCEQVGNNSQVPVLDVITIHNYRPR